MAVVFHRAPVVAVGDPITSTQRNAQAQALIDRMVSGLGDPTFRIADALRGMYRQLRNTDASGNLQPPECEFSELYQHVDPTEAYYPDAPPGTPEGINVVHPLGAFVHGSEAMGLYAESDRLSEVPLTLGGLIPVADSEWWELAKCQRGYYDPVTGGMGCPAINAARSHLPIRYSRDSMTGNMFASYAPGPSPVLDDLGEGVGFCDDADPPDKPPSANWVIYFSTVREGVNTTGLHGSIETLPSGGLRMTYPGTCPNHDGHVLGVYEEDGSNGFIFVQLVSGAASVWDVLSKRDWMQGPYAGGGRLQRHPTGGIFRLLNGFAREYRGTPEQRAKVWMNEAFDTQRFGTTQYLLAPARGTESGGLLTGAYPAWRTTSSAAAGTRIPYYFGGGTEHIFEAGFVCAGFLVCASGVAAPVRLEAMDGDTVIEAFTLAPSDGQINKICMLRTPATPAALSFRLASGLQLAEGAVLLIEATELYPYLPTVEDWYVVTRLGGASNALPDGTGMTEEMARQISDHYFATGSLRNVYGIGWMDGNEFTGFNRNGVVETFRRFSRNCSRLITRDLFLGIAVIDGQTHLWFRRIRDVNGVEIDPWEGIAPGRMRIESGAIREGYRYRVRSGTVIYAGEARHAGDEFTGLRGETEYGASGEVYEADGIRATAPPAGETNQWLLGCWLKPYDQVNGDISEESVWKPSVDADIYPFGQRCFIGSWEILNRDGSLKWNINQGMPAAWKPESPSAYLYTPIYPGGPNANRGYMGGTISAQNQLLFFQSCRIYEPDLQIESATAEIEGGVEVVHLVLTGRLHNTSAAVEMDEEGAIGAASWRAPASFSRDTSTWDAAAIKAEGYRTLENGLREYLLFQTTGTPASVKMGDRFAANPPVEVVGPGSPEGCAFPHFLLTHLPTLVYEDGDDVQTPGRDTPFSSDYVAQMELYLRAIGVAYVDGATTEALACVVSNEHLMDFTWPNLCYAAFGKSSLNWFSSTDRPDNVPGCGPVPATYSRAELFNQISQVLNELTKVRVDLPLNWVTTYDHKAGRRETSLDGSASCAETWSGPTAATTALGEDGFAHAFSSSTLVKEDGKWWIDSHHQTASLAAEFADASSVYALPESWRSQALAWLGVFCQVDYWEFWNNGRVAGTTPCDCGSYGPYSFTPAFTQHDTSQTFCRVFDRMSLEVDPPPDCWHYGCVGGGVDCGCATAGNLRALTVTPKTNAGAYLSVPLA